MMGYWSAYAYAYASPRYFGQWLPYRQSVCLPSFHTTVTELWVFAGSVQSTEKIIPSPWPHCSSLAQSSFRLQSASNFQSLPIILLQRAPLMSYAYVWSTPVFLNCGFYCMEVQRSSLVLPTYIRFWWSPLKSHPRPWDTMRMLCE